MEAAGQKSEMGAQVSASDASSLEIAPALLSYDDWSEPYLKDAHASLTHDSLSLLVNKLSRLKMILRRISDAGGSRLAVARLPTHLYAYMYVYLYSFLSVASVLTAWSPCGHRQPDRMDTHIARAVIQVGQMVDEDVGWPREVARNIDDTCSSCVVCQPTAIL